MSDVDGLLERLKCIAACESCKRGVGRAMNATDVLDIIATIEQQRAELQTYKTASSYWYVKCLMDRGHKVDPHSSSQHDDQVIRDMAAERRENKEIIEQQRAEIERLRSQLSPRCSIPADMELDDVIVRFTNRTDEPC